MPEYKVQETKRSKLILLHYGIFKIGWDWMILLCTFYIAITVPYNAAFVMTSQDPFTQRASIVSDVIVEMLFVIGQSVHFASTVVSSKVCFDHPRSGVVQKASAQFCIYL